MGGDFLGGGVIIAVAAFLWLIYLVPTWNRRRAFMATERNAVRLQQTLRILAETGDVPDEMKLESAARTAAKEKRDVKEQEAIRKANVKAALRAARRNARVELLRLCGSRVARLPRIPAHRIRQVRAVASLVGGMSITTMILGGIVAASTGNATVFFLGATTFGIAISAIVWLARVNAPISVAESSEQSRLPVSYATTTAVDIMVETPVIEDRTWTPRALPKPLYLSHDQLVAYSGRPSSGSVTQDVCDDSVIAPVTPMRTPISVSAHSRGHSRVSETSSTAPRSRFEGMGIVDDSALGSVDLDAVFRGRRAAS